MLNYKIAIIGLGYVGLPLAVEFGKFFNVIGFDLRKIRISQLKKKIDITKEVSKTSLTSAKKLSFTNDLNSIKNCNIYIICVPTPIDNANRPDLYHLKKASQDIGSILKKEDIVIFESTVFPGATEEICVPILSKESNLTYNKDFFCGYSPERINPGDKINTLTKVPKIVSGSNKKVLKKIFSLYSKIIKSYVYKVSSIKVAEAAKIIENCQRDLNIAFINELAIIFNKLDIDTSEVLDAAKTKWNFMPFKPGMVGGHCIGVDPYYLTHKAEEMGYIPQVILAGRKINDNMASYAAENIVKKMAQNNINISNSSLAVLGITFKENCPDIRNSKIIDLVSELSSWNIKIKVVDNWVDKGSLKSDFKINIVEFSELKNLDGIIVAVGHKEFRKLDPKLLYEKCNKKIMPILGDLKSLYNMSKCEEIGFSVFRL